MWTLRALMIDGSISKYDDVDVIAFLLVSTIGLMVCG